MNFLSYKFEEWIKDHIVMLSIIVTGLVILCVIIIMIISVCKKQKNIKNFQKIWKRGDSKDLSISPFLGDLEISAFNFKINKMSDNKKLAWYGIIELITRVSLNKFDEDYGDEKGTLTSIYTMYKNFRFEIQKFPKAIKTSSVLLKLMNYEMRWFLTKWNHLINEENVFKNKYCQSNEINIINPINYFKKQFLNDYEKFLNSIKENKYMENLFWIIGFKLDVNSYTIDQVKNQKLSK